jgi:coatomer subunit beta'
MNIALQVEKMFLAQRDQTKDVGIPAKDYMTAKEDLNLNLIELIKAKTQPPSAAASPSARETKEPDPADDDTAAKAADAARIRAEQETAAKAAEAARVKAEQEAAFEAARLRAEEEEAAAAAAEAEPKEDSMNDFADDW